MATQFTKSLTEYFTIFDEKFKDVEKFDNTFYEDLGVKSYISKASAKDKKGNFSEEYIRARFVYAMVHSGMYDKENICVEFQIPKGNGAKNLKPDIVVFKNTDWEKDFLEAKANKNFSTIRKNLLVIFETKKNNQSVALAIENQLRSAMNENESKDRIFGVYFDNEDGILIFKKEDNSAIKRYDEGKIAENNGINIRNRDLLIDLPSKKDFIENNKKISDLSKLKLEDLTSVDEKSFTKFSLEEINRAQDQIKPDSDAHTLIVEFLTLKVFDEKESLRTPDRNLLFYYDRNEKLSIFRRRIEKLYKSAQRAYKKVLSTPIFKYSKDNIPSSSSDEKLLIMIVEILQRKTILNAKNNESFNQIIFNNFANDKQKAAKGQFFTPIPVVKHIISLLNPKKDETFCDPCCGIADFLAMGFRHIHEEEIISNSFLKAADNFYGFDTDKNVLKLAELNLVLNGDGGATLKHMDSLGQKYLENETITKSETAEFSTTNFRKEDWKNRNDPQKNPQKYKIIATNPPFGKGRDLKTKDEHWDLPQETVEMYETYFEKSKKPDGTAGNLPNSMDMGVLFLENAYKLLEDGGRMGIVLSNSIASIKEWQNIRKWFLEKMRLVATFDLPSNTFGETGVATTVLIAYKPKHNEQHLLTNDYEVYVKEIEHTGYEVKTKQRIVHFEPQFIIDEETFEKTDILQEDFSGMLEEFQEFLKRQEVEIKNAFGFNK